MLYYIQYLFSKVNIYNIKNYICFFKYTSTNMFNKCIKF